MFPRVLLPILACLLVSCGGGGSDSPAPPPGNSVTFSPSTLTATQYEGDSTALQVQVTATGAFTGSVYAFLIDRVGVIQPNASVTANGNVYTGTLSLSPNLAVGLHTGELELHLCRDSSCTQSYAGSPWRLPYRFEIISATNLTPLARWAGVADWEQYQRNETHTGYVPVTLNPATFNRRWRWSAPAPYQGINPITVSDGRVYVTTTGWFSDAALFALAEADRSMLWQFPFGSIFRVHPPSATAGRVFASSSGHADTFMWSFDAATGNLVSKTPFLSQWEAYGAPTIRDGVVYNDGGSYGGLVTFDFADGAARWAATGLNQYDGWTPAVDAAYAYAYSGTQYSGDTSSGLYALDKSTGAVAFQIRDPDFVWSGWTLPGSPVIGSDAAVYVVNNRTATYDANRLIRFDPAARSIGWSVSGRYRTNPAFANGVVYAANANPVRVEARNAADGSLLWWWTPGAGENDFAGDLVVTDNVLFVSTNLRVHAIDLASHASVWTFPRPGELALSANGVLYVTTLTSVSAVSRQSDGQLFAINVK